MYRNFADHHGSFLERLSSSPLPSTKMAVPSANCQSMPKPYVPVRRRGGRRLPATPTQPSTLNIDSLSYAKVTLGADLFNFPRLETSPTRMKNFLQGIRKGARLASDGILSQQQPPQRSLPMGQAVGRWSRSLDDPITFEEAVIAGRGTRQLPVVGPQQILSGRGRGGPKRELPRPGTTIGFTVNPPYLPQSAYGDSEEDEDWC